MRRFEPLPPEPDPDPSPGDLLQLNEGEHELDLSEKKAVESEGSSHQGLGGDRVWKDVLDPDEQNSLKNFFR